MLCVEESGINAKDAKGRRKGREGKTQRARRRSIREPTKVCHECTNRKLDGRRVGGESLRALRKELCGLCVENSGLNAKDAKGRRKGHEGKTQRTRREDAKDTKARHTECAVD
ncbi:MAG: hypothetical protein DCC44_06185 [Acidobacteria bacterium]|nr:MAG: hypothetical protein DCC44_06185 [Acidobacteriota bacterium]